MKQNLEWEQLKELIRLKNEEPKEYKKLLEDIAEVISDLTILAKKTAEKFID